MSMAEEINFESFTFPLGKGGINSQDKLTKLQLFHHFNHAVDLVLPGLDCVPPALAAELEQQHAYVVEQLPLTKFLDEEFIEAFMLKGPLYMLSCDTRVDNDDCIALIPPGVLIMSLTRDTYQQLGLQGTLSSCYTPKTKKSRYVVTIQLCTENFRPGRKEVRRKPHMTSYDRTRTAFERLNLAFDFLVTWQPADSLICSSSMKYYLQDVCGYTCLDYHASFTTRLMRDVPLPHIQRGPQNMSIGEEDVMSSTDFYEWLGGVACGIDFSGRPDDFVSSLCHPDSFVKHENVLVCQYQGMLIPQSMEIISNILRLCVNKDQVRRPWAAMTVHGFQDSPLTWGVTEHSCTDTTHNFYSVVHLPNQCWVYKPNNNRSQNMPTKTVTGEV